MAIGCGLTVGSIYYVQPLLPELSKEFHCSISAAQSVATFCQLGYAAGMFLIVPLGDLLERKKLIMGTVFMACLASILMGFAGSIPVAMAAGLILGLFSATPHVLIPFAAHLAAPEKRGQVVGSVMSGLLIGILLARTYSGFLGGWLGWHSPFLVGAVLLLILNGLVYAVLPISKPEGKLTLSGLYPSMLELVKSSVVLRQSMFFGFMGMFTFCTFWNTYAYHLAAPPFHLGPAQAGLLGLVGFSGASVAPIAGKLGDKGNPVRQILAGFVIVAAAYLIMGWFGSSLIALILCTLAMDAGVQLSHISNQSRNFADLPNHRSRVNSVYMTTYFLGGTFGSLSGGLAYVHFQWWGVCLVSSAAACAGTIGSWRLLRRGHIQRLTPVEESTAGTPLPNS